MERKGNNIAEDTFLHWMDVERYIAEFKEAERKCIEVALAHGVRPRCEIVTPADAEYYVKLGVKDFSLGDQLAKMKAFWNGEGKEMRAIVDDLK